MADNHPAELPEGEGGGGGGRLGRPRGGIGGPNELPADMFRVSQLVNEIFNLRDRVHALESSVLAAKMSGSLGTAVARRSVIGGPNELPEGELGGGGGGGGRIPHGEIHEIAELPINRFVTELSSLATRFSQFETNILKQLTGINQRLDALKK